MEAGGHVPDLGRDEFDFVPLGMEVVIRDSILDLGRKALEETIERIPGGEFEAEWHLYEDQELSGHPKTAITVGPGFARLQTMAPLEQSRGGPDTIHSKLIEMIRALPPDLQNGQYFGEDLVMIQFAFLRYRAESRLAVPSNNDRGGGDAESVRSFQFPRDRGHRDTLPEKAIVISEQLAGPSAKWEIINSRGEHYTLEHRTGTRVRTRSGGFNGTDSEGRPWHDISSGEGGDRYTALFAYSVNPSIAR